MSEASGDDGVSTDSLALTPATRDCAPTGVGGATGDVASRLTLRGCWPLRGTAPTTGAGCTACIVGTGSGTVCCNCCIGGIPPGIDIGMSIGTRPLTGTAGIKGMAICCAPAGAPPAGICSVWLTAAICMCACARICACIACAMIGGIASASDAYEWAAGAEAGAARVPAAVAVAVAAAVAVAVAVAGGSAAAAGLAAAAAVNAATWAVLRPVLLTISLGCERMRDQRQRAS